MFLLDRHSHWYFEYKFSGWLPQEVLEYHLNKARIQVKRELNKSIFGLGNLLDISKEGGDKDA